MVADGDGVLRESERLCELGVNAQPLQVDLATSEGVLEVFSALSGRPNPPDALIVNAGIGVSHAFLARPWEDALRLLQLNVISAAHLSRLVLPSMVARGRGRVLFTSSIAGIAPAPFEAVYGASKAFLLSFSASLREELKGSGVTVTAMLPGPTDTNFFRRAGLEDTKVGAMDKDDPAQVARQGFDAMMAGRERIVAGSLSTKLLGRAARFMPESIKAKLHREASAPGSAFRGN
jgi:short-subunit dehydrogenase